MMAVQAVSATAPVLPPEVEAALVRSRLPCEALSVVVVDAQGGAGAADALCTARRCRSTPLR